MQHITKAQLLAAISEFADDTPVFINIGVKNYPVSDICFGTASGNWGIILECGAKIGRPRYESEAERREARLKANAKYNEKRRKDREA